MHDNHEHEMLTTIAGNKMLMMTGKKEGLKRGTEEEDWTEKMMVASIDEDNDEDADDDWQ